VCHGVTAASQTYAVCYGRKVGAWWNYLRAMSREVRRGM